MLVITVGKNYVDIDGYASAIAYRELFKLRGIESVFVTNAVLNYSITKSLIDLGFKIDKYNIKDSDKFIILDLSNPNFLPGFVREDNIVEIIDHHPGYEEYWKNTNSIIEPIGSVATIIVEKYEECNLLDKMDKDIALLLMAAILDNTLNFTADITCDRDKNAYKKLEEITKEYNYQEIYFKECQNYVESNLKDSIINDIKIEKDNKYLPEVIGQLTVWDIDKVLKEKETIKDIMSNYDKWLINIISLKDNKSYILCSSKSVIDRFSKLFECIIDNDIVILDSKLRKEILKRSYVIKTGVISN